jgi:hypothetical protein
VHTAENSTVRAFDLTIARRIWCSSTKSIRIVQAARTGVVPEVSSLESMSLVIGRCKNTTSGLALGSETPTSNWLSLQSCTAISSTTLHSDDMQDTESIVEPLLSMIQLHVLENDAFIFVNNEDVIYILIKFD